VRNGLCRSRCIHYKKPFEDTGLLQYLADYLLAAGLQKAKIPLSNCLQAIEQTLTNIRPPSTFTLIYQYFHSFLIGFNEGPSTQVRVCLIEQRLDC
jgi:hypothetical protein